MTNAVSPTLTPQLEDVLDADVPCQSGHSTRGNRECSIEVTHRVGTTCRAGEVSNVCINHVLWIEGHQSVKFVCHYCRRPIKKCWTCTPV